MKVLSLIAVVMDRKVLAFFCRGCRRDPVDQLPWKPAVQDDPRSAIGLVQKVSPIAIKGSLLHALPKALQNLLLISKLSKESSEYGQSHVYI